MPLPRTTKTRNQTAETWQRLADIRLAVPGYGYIRVRDLLQQVSAADTDTGTRKQLLLELADFAALLSPVLAPLPLTERDEIIERITDAVREACERDG